MHQINPAGCEAGGARSHLDRGAARRKTSFAADPNSLLYLFDGAASRRLEDAIVHRIAERLDHSALSGDLIRQVFDEACADDPDLGNASAPTWWRSTTAIPPPPGSFDPLLYFKGFHALQTHRLAQLALPEGPQGLCQLFAEPFVGGVQTDINPAARIGRGIFLDHATGFVCGETAVIEDDVSILHGVTLGGTGKENEDRHPKIRHGVMIGAGAKILGNIEIGHLRADCRRLPWW